MGAYTRITLECDRCDAREEFNACDVRELWEWENRVICDRRIFDEWKYTAYDAIAASKLFTVYDEDDLLLVAQPIERASPTISVRLPLGWSSTYIVRRTIWFGPRLELARLAEHHECFVIVAGFHDRFDVHDRGTEPGPGSRAEDPPARNRRGRMARTFRGAVRGAVVSDDDPPPS